MTSSVKIASRVNALVASEVQRAEDLALIAWVLVARGLRPAKGRKAADRCTSRGGGCLAIRREAPRDQHQNRFVALEGRSDLQFCTQHSENPSR
jgi:hypothetical protein